MTKRLLLKVFGLSEQPCLISLVKSIDALNSYVAAADSAATANPLPCSLARAASILAFSTRKFVYPEMEEVD
ncbi:hypothetical protein HMPREF9372_1846 [Sporosarcina newyorkensis 2681]|uniref:Uncharacterized protein n=1 Tax=Sporosarcina newyorkensis 2681 TaxID=1027292 RepID=F9DSR5_9BACL|nr:hypothetical protein HMPREF9372_1846 [Sporosarcina newyorkensis 2681]